MTRLAPIAFGLFLTSWLLTGCHPPAPVPAHVVPTETVAGVAAQATEAMTQAQKAFDEKRWPACMGACDTALSLFKLNGSVNTSPEIKRLRVLEAEAAFHAHDATALQRLNDLKTDGLSDAEADSELQQAQAAMSPFPLLPGSRYGYVEKLEIQVIASGSAESDSDEKLDHDSVTTIFKDKQGRVRFEDRDPKKPAEPPDVSYYGFKDGSVWYEGDTHGMFDKPVCYLKVGAPVGTTWVTSPYRVWTHLTSQDTCRIESGGEVSVPAGRFKNCLRVTRTGPLSGRFNLGHTEYEVRPESHVEQTEWLAPGVGEVKSDLVMRLILPHHTQVKLEVSEVLQPGYHVATKT